jgi:hypothetical protein
VVVGMVLSFRSIGFTVAEPTRFGNAVYQWSQRLTGAGAGDNVHVSRKKHWVRVTYERDGIRRALFGLGRSPLGGLIVDVGAYKPFPEWGCGIFDLPACVGPGQVATVDDETKLEPVIAPKVHYHPSGHISIDHHGRVERRSIEGNRWPLSAALLRTC